MAQQAVAQNLYGAPRAAVDDRAEQYQPVKLLSVSGRIGRARYIAYSMGLSALIMALGFAGVLALGDVGGTVVAVVAYIALFVLSMMLTIQRSHDFNMSGWFSLLMFVPLVGIIFWFIPGTDGRNRFGAETPPNTWPVLVAVWLLPAVFVLGIVAAISIPAYQDYQKRAEQRR